MQHKINTLALVAALAGLATVTSGCASESGYARGPSSYDNDPHYASYRYYADQCGREKHDRNVAGTAIGAVAGALLGNAVSRGGGRTGGTIIGGVAGAAVGSNIARSTINCDGGQPYWTADQTVDYDRYQGYKGEHDNDWYRSHDCRWVPGREGDGDYVRVCRGRNGNYYPAY